MVRLVRTTVIVVMRMVVAMMVKVRMDGYDDTGDGDAYPAGNVTVMVKVMIMIVMVVIMVAVMGMAVMEMMVEMMMEMMVTKITVMTVVMMVTMIMVMVAVTMAMMKPHEGRNLCLVHRRVPSS